MSTLRSVALGVAGTLAVLVMLAFARPGNEQQLMQLLNGQETRWRMADGGQSGMGGNTCMLLSTMPAAGNGVVEVVATGPINLCYGHLGASGTDYWDGGCNTYITDPNFGVPVQPYVPKFVSLKTTDTHICQASDAGSVTAVFSMQ